MSEQPAAYNHPFQWDFVLQAVEHRLGMWVGRPTYERAVALVTGFDMAQPTSIQQRMWSRICTGSVDWPWVLLELAINRPVDDLGPLAAEEDAAAISLLVTELRAVLSEHVDAPRETP